jgi:hypothetical protein
MHPDEKATIIFHWPDFEQNTPTKSVAL